MDLLYAFNSGDIATFEKMKPHWESVADLRAQELKLRQKISLLCLMEVSEFLKLWHSFILSYNITVREILILFLTLYSFI